MSGYWIEHVPAFSDCLSAGIFKEDVYCEGWFFVCFFYRKVESLIWPTEICKTSIWNIYTKWYFSSVLKK